MVKKLTVSDLLNLESIVFNESYVKAYYVSDVKLFLIVWDGVFSDEEYKNLFEFLLTFAQTNEVVAVYSDVRRQGRVSPECSRYFKNHVSPRGDALGMQKAAAVIDGSPFKLFYLNTLTKFAGRRARIFSEPEEALQYLLKE